MSGAEEKREIKLKIAAHKYGGDFNKPIALLDPKITDGKIYYNIDLSAFDIDAMLTIESLAMYSQADMDKALAEQREACINSMKKLVQDQNWNYADAIFDALYKACEDARIEE